MPAKVTVSLAVYSFIISLEVAMSTNYTVTKTNNTNLFPGHTFGEWRNEGAFGVIKADGSVVTWGNSTTGGDSSGVASQINGTIDVSQIYSTAARQESSSPQKR